MLIYNSKGELMKIFLKTNFTGFNNNTTLISIALIDENDNSFYGEFTDYDKTQVDKWINDNIIETLFLMKELRGEQFLLRSEKELNVVGGSKFIQRNLKEWLQNYDHAEICPDSLSFDWKLFDELLYKDETIYSFDKNPISYFPYDLKELFKEKGIDPDISNEFLVRDRIKKLNSNEIKKYNSLYDAKITKMCYEYLIKL